jgi:predicted nucleic acid-binding protein
LQTLSSINPDIAQLWGKLRVSHYENALDKQIAATALIYDLTMVSRNHKDFLENRRTDSESVFTLSAGSDFFIGRF